MSVMTVTYISASADDNTSSKAPRELSKEELDAYIGRMGEVEKIPEDFQFSEAENQLWLSDHLGNITQPMNLYYDFVKSGSYEDGFTDSVYLKILKINEDGTKNAALEFFSGDRRQPVRPENVTNIVGNPILGIFLQGDVYEMNRLTEGNWRHFHKKIKIALRETATVEPVTINYNGTEVAAKKITFSPYVKDEHRADFEQFADKKYEIILSEHVPGSLYMIRTVVDSKDTGVTEPLIEEVLTLADVKTLK